MQRRTLLALLALIIIASTFESSSVLRVNAATQPVPWVNISPSQVSIDFNTPSNNYGFNTVVVDPTNPSTLYVGTCYQGLWKSSDGGLSWTKRNTGAGGSLLDSGRLWSLVIDPVNPQILYTTAGYGAGGILKSTDGGVSWQDVFSRSPQATQLGTHDIYGIALDPWNHQHLLAAFHYYWYGNQASGLVESTDGGASWTIHAPPAVSWGAGNSVWFVNNSQTWLVGSQSGGIWRTTDGGSSWSQVYSQNLTHGGINALTIDPTTGRLYLGLWNQIATSSDHGATWTQVSAGLPYASYQAFADDGHTLYTAPAFPDGGTNSQDTATYQMPVGGSSWTQMSGPTCTSGGCNGPAQAATAGGAVYTVNWDAGVWKLPIGTSSSPPTKTPLPTQTSSPTAIPTTRPPTGTPMPATTTPRPVTSTPVPTSTILNLLANGGFESGQSPWHSTSLLSQTMVISGFAHSGSRSGFLCGYDNCRDALWQTFNVPAGLTRATVTLWVASVTGDASTACTDSLYLLFLTSTGSVIQPPFGSCNFNSLGSWLPVSVDVSSYLTPHRGQQVTMLLLGTTNATVPSYYFVDDMSLLATSEAAVVGASSKQTGPFHVSPDPPCRLSPGEKLTCQTNPGALQTE